MFFSEDMTPYQQEPVVIMDDAMVKLQNLLGMNTHQFQLFALQYLKGAGHTLNDCPVVDRLIADNWGTTVIPGTGD